MNRTVISALWTLVFAGLALTGIARVSASEPRIPYPEALDAAAVSVDRLDSILEYALLVGNGDINALVYSDGGQLKLMLTKNDVWDARLDSKLDPPLPTLALIKKLGPVSPTKYGTSSVILDQGSTWQGPDSYHAHPYPCPRPCARLVLSERPEQPCWKNIRALGSRTRWETRGTAAVMGLEGPAGSSNGYAFGPLNVTGDQYTRLRLKVAGSPNARFFIDVIGPERQPVLSSGWTDSPTEIEERSFSLRPGCRIEQLILYTWTEDGKPAENRFESLMLEGPAGQLAIPLEHVATPTCPGRLDIRRAVASVPGEPGVVPTAEIRALADRNVFLIQSAAAASLVPITSADVVTAQPAASDGAVCLVQEIPGDLDWPGMSYAVALMHQADRIAVAVVTSREAADPRAAAVQLARSTLAEDESPLVASHERQWTEFWSASGIDVPDTILRDAWYRNLYFLRCVTRPGVIAPGLFASLIDDTPAWHGDYHTNYNIQQTFWPALVTNHADLAEPYDRLIREYLPRARWLARTVFDMDGAYYPHVLFAYEPPDPAQCKSPGGRQYLHHVWGFTLGVAGFSVQPVWWHYKYAPSREFLEQTAYPVVREVAQFYAAFVEQCEGDSHVVLAPSVSPEHWGWTENFQRNRDGTFDIALVRYVLEAASEGATTLGCDAPLVERWTQALRRLPPYPTTPGEKPIVVDVRDAPPINYNIAVPAVPVFPGDVVGWWSPEAERNLFARTIDQLQWNGNNSAIMLAVARARLSLPGTVDWTREELQTRLRPNGTLTLNRLGAHFNQFGHYTEQFGASLAVSELLIQSVHDAIRVFPAWPAAQDARFENLRTQGGFLVSARQAGGRIAALEIHSTVGGALRLVSPFGAVRVRSADGAQTHALQPDARGVIQLDTQPGQRWLFEPAVE